MKKLLIILIPVLLMYGCGGKKSEPAPIIPPFSATLVAPVQNEVCTQGTVLSSTQSTVTLKWNLALSTDSYEVDIKNLETGVVTVQNTNNTQIDVTLTRGVPYSWFVISKSSATPTTAQSPTWKFYNSGPSLVNYAPFPADFVSPTLAQSVTATDLKVTLTWTGSDVDNDIAGYSVYFGNTANPPLLKSNVTASSLSDVAVTAGGTFYWKIITADAKGNTSDSGVFWFKVN